MRLATKLTLVLSTTFALIFLIAAWWVGHREAVFADAQAGLHGRLLGRVVASMVHETWTERGEEEARELLREIDRQEPWITVRWVALEAAAGDWDYSAIVSSPLRERLQRGEVVESINPDDDGQEVLYTLVPVASPDGRVERAVEIAESLESRDVYLSELRLQLIAMALLALLVAAVGAHALGRSLVGRPVARLVETARRIGAGNLSARLEPRGRDELALLAHEMNAMVSQLDEALGAQREAIRQLQHAERLATVGQLASGVAHEIRSPLQVIAMRAEILARRTDDAELTRESAELVCEQVAQIRKIVDELLSFARRDVPHREVHDLCEIVEHTLTLLRMVSTDRPVEIVCLADEDSPGAPLAVVDAEQVRQVLSNLVLNAVQAMPQGGRVTVRLGRTRRERPPAAPDTGDDQVADVDEDTTESPVSADAGNGAAAEVLPETDEFVCLAVEDEGTGIAPEVIERMFEPFFTTKARGEGTGLGLAICRGIVEEHGGIIEVDSEPGRGTIFRVYLPAAGGAPDGIAPDAQPDEGLERRQSST